MLTLFICFFTTQGMHAQDPELVDSLLIVLATAEDTARLEPLTELFMEHLYTDHVKAKSYVEEYIEIARAEGEKRHVAFGTNLLGVYYNVISNYSEGLQIFHEAKSLYEELGNLERVSALLNNLSIANRNLGNLEAALQNQMESLRIKEEIGVDDEALAASYWNIGNIQGDIHNYTESNAWYRKAKTIYERLNLEDDRIDVQNNLALNLVAMDSPAVAMPIFEEALAYYRKRNFHNSVAGCLDNMGNLAKKRGDLDDAEKYYLESLDIALNHGEESLPGLLYRRLADLYRKKGDFSTALDYAEKAIEVSRKTGVRKKMITDYLVLSQITEDMGDPVQSLAYYKQYHELNDSIFAEEKILAMNELEIKYQTEKKEQEIQLLNEKGKRSVLMQRSLAGAIVALIIFIAMLSYSIRQRAKRNKAEKAKLDAELDFKKRELSAFALQLAQKNEAIKTIQDDIAGIKRSPEQHRELLKVNRKIDQTLSDDTNWEQFLQRFEAVHQGYQQKITETYPDVTQNDLRLMALIKMHLSSKEIASILNLSHEGIKKARYRLRKKLGIETADSLDDFVVKIF